MVHTFLVRIRLAFGLLLIGLTIGIAATPAKAGGFHHKGQKYRAVNAYIVGGQPAVASAPALSYAPSAPVYSAPAAAAATVGYTVYTVQLPAPASAPAAAPAPAAQAPAPAAQAAAPAPAAAPSTVTYVTVQAAAAPLPATAILTPLTPVTVLVPHRCGIFCKH